MELESNNTIKNVSSKHRSKLHEIAENNTIRNSDGLTVLPKDDVWREDDAIENVFIKRANEKRNPLSGEELFNETIKLFTDNNMNIEKLNEVLAEVEAIEKGLLPKRSVRDLIKELREE